MSHIKLIEPEREYRVPSLAVMAELMGAVMVRSKSFQWYGRWVGDNPLPEGLVLNDLEEVSYEIKYPNSKYTIGVKEKNGKVYLLYDFWQGGFGLEAALGGKDCRKLKQHYNMAEVLLAAKKQRRRVREVKGLTDRKRLIIDMK